MDNRAINRALFKVHGRLGFESLGTLSKSGLDRHAEEYGMEGVLRGIVIWLVGAYLYCILLVLNESLLEKQFEYHFIELFIITPLFFMLYASWFVFPTGALLGFLIPKAVKNETRKRAIIYGALFGVGLGVVGGCVLSVFFNSWLSTNTRWTDPVWRASFAKKTAEACFAITLYSIPWTTIYAYLLSA